MFIKRCVMLNLFKVASINIPSDSIFFVNQLLKMQKRLRFGLLHFLFALPILSAQQRPVAEIDVESAIGSVKQFGDSEQYRVYEAVQKHGLGGLESLRQHAFDQEKMVRRLVLKGFRWMNAPCVEISNIISRSLHDQDHLVRYNAVVLIAAQKCRDKKNELFNLIEKEPDEQTRDMAIQTLGTIGDSEDFPYLKRLEQSQDLRMISRLRACYALAELNGPYDKKLAAESLRSDQEQIVKEAMYVYSLSKNLEDIEHLRPLLNQEFPISSQAEIAINSISLNQDSKGQQEKIEFLLSLLNDDTEDVRMWAANHLTNRFASPEVTDELVEISTGKIASKGAREVSLCLIKNKVISEEQLIEKMEIERK